VNIVGCRKVPPGTASFRDTGGGTGTKA